MHFMTIVVAACWITRVGPGESAVAFAESGAGASDRVLLVLVVYVAVIFGGGYLIRFMTRPLLKTFAGGGIAGAIEQRGDVHRLAGTIFGDDGAIFTFSRDRGIDSGGEVHRALSGV